MFLMFLIYKSSNNFFFLEHLQREKSASRKYFAATTTTTTTKKNGFICANMCTQIYRINVQQKYENCVHGMGYLEAKLP